MPARSIGTGTLSFGMVSIPIRLYSAGESASAVSFNLLHAKCKTRLKQQYVCPKDEEIVARDQMVKGYEFSKDQYVTFTEDELKAMAEESQRAIEITEFVPASAVDAVYYDGAYYLGPDKGGDKAYRLLNEAMKQTGRAALAKWAARGKQYLVLIRPSGKGIVMQQLLYADEVRPISEVPMEDAEVKDTRAQARGPDHRADRARRVPPRELRGRGPQALPGRDPAQGRGPRDHGGPRAAQGPDHRPDGGAEGQPRAEGGRGTRGEGQEAGLVPLSGKATGTEAARAVGRRLAPHRGRLAGRRDRGRGRVRALPAVAPVVPCSSRGRR